MEQLCVNTHTHTLVCTNTYTYTCTCVHYLNVVEFTCGIFGSIDISTVIEMSEKATTTATTTVTTTTKPNLSAQRCIKSINSIGTTNVCCQNIICYKSVRACLSDVIFFLSAIQSNGFIYLLQFFVRRVLSKSFGALLGCALLLILLLIGGAFFCCCRFKRNYA